MRMRISFKNMAEKRVYNDRFQFADPCASSSISRSTRQRLSRKRKTEESGTNTQSALPAVDLTVGDDADDDHDCSLPIDGECISENYRVPSVDALVCLHAGTTTELQAIFPDEPILTEYGDDAISDKEDPEEVYDLTEKENDGNSEALSQTTEEALFAGCPLTTNSSNLLILQFKMRHNLTQEALADLLKLLQLHCPSPNHCLPSVYLFNKRFEGLKCPLQLHYFCTNCLQELTENDINECPNHSCARDLQVLGGKSSFIEVPIEQQLKSMMERKYILGFHLLFHKLCTANCMQYSCFVCA